MGETRTRVVGYIRVSTDRQAEKGQSLEVQRRKLHAYAELYELELVALIEDPGHSAKSLDRPGLQRALGMLRAREADALLVAKLDRLSRSVRDLGSLVDDYFGKGRWALLSVGEQLDTRSAAGRLVLNVLASIGQWERETITERTQEGKRAKQAKGGFIGGAAPYGFALDAKGQLVAVLAEQCVLARAHEMRDRRLSLRAIADELGRLGYVSRSGRPFQAVQVSRMLRPAPALQDAPAGVVVAA